MAKATVEHAAAVKAVRRELRRLTEEDREEYFRALHAVFTTDQEEGEAAYGPEHPEVAQTLTNLGCASIALFYFTFLLSF